MSPLPTAWPIGWSLHRPPGPGRGVIFVRVSSLLAAPHNVGLGNSRSLTAVRRSRLLPRHGGHGVGVSELSVSDSGGSDQRCSAVDRRSKLGKTGTVERIPHPLATPVAVYETGRA